MTRTTNESSNCHDAISEALIREVCERFAHGKRIRQTLPGGGLLNIDRLLPFLCVYRRIPTRRDAGTRQFVTAEASFLSAPGDAPVRQGLQTLVRRLAETGVKHLGAFLVLEVWASDDRTVPRLVDPSTGELLLPGPAFALCFHQTDVSSETVARLELELQRVRLHRQTAVVDVRRGQPPHPPGTRPLLTAVVARRIGCQVLGLEIRPTYRNGEAGDVFERQHRQLRKSVSRAVKKAIFTFALHHTQIRPQHYFSLGRRSIPQSVFHVDRKLAEVSSQFKFLLLVTPVNAERSWQEFSSSGYVGEPRFQYRPLDADPLLLKRQLLRIRTEQIDDPTLGHVLRQTQDELDRQITMLADLGTRRFLPGSMQVFGVVEPSLREMADQILARLPGDFAEVGRGETSVGAKRFARLATREIEYYRQQYPAFAAQAVVRDDMYSGLLSTGGNLLIGREMQIARRRVNALLQHEVGTHLVTYYNGHAQPLKLLKVGLAGYDGLQEGLAVLSEYLVGGLSRGRMRTLAARVVAVDTMTRGMPFQETYALLVDQHRFEPRTAFTIALRVYRGGGLTKDAVYLRGLVEILRFLVKGGDLEPLFVGKLAADHIPVVQELLLRRVLRPPLVRPRYLDQPEPVRRINQLRTGSTVIELLDSLSTAEDES